MNSLNHRLEIRDSYPEHCHIPSGRNRLGMIYRFDSEIPLITLRCKVEVNTPEHFSVVH
jgi:hypothetical protein